MLQFKSMSSRKIALLSVILAAACVLGFQNCSASKSAKQENTDASSVNYAGNGGGYQGKLYVLVGTCGNNSAAHKTEIIYDEETTASVIKENCVNLKAPRALAPNNYIFDSQGNLVYQNETYVLTAPTRAACSEILANNESTGDGVYAVVTPTGMATLSYCDMTLDGGGWTLVMKIAANSPIFGFSSPYWKNYDLLNDKNINLAPGDAKYPCFNNCPISTLRIANIQSGLAMTVNLQSLLSFPKTPREFFSGSATLLGAHAAGSPDYLPEVDFGIGDDCSGLPSFRSYSRGVSITGTPPISYRLGRHGVAISTGDCVRGIGLGGWAGEIGAVENVTVWGR